TINRGVRQGDTLSPMIFNLCINMLLDKLDRDIKGIQIYGEVITGLAFADDLAVFISCLQELPILEKILSEFKSKAGLLVSIKKTKFMPFGDDRQTVWENVSEFRYLGIVFKKQGLI